MSPRVNPQGEPMPTAASILAELNRSQFHMSGVLTGFVEVLKAEVSPQHLRIRSEISPCHIALECRSGSSASSFLASAVLILSHPSNRLVPRAFSETALASVLKRE